MVTPIDVLKVFSAVNSNDAPQWAHLLRLPNVPQDLIIQVLPVAPAPIRPSVQALGGRNSVDSLTT